MGLKRWKGWQVKRWRVFWNLLLEIDTFHATSNPG
jgi:hypothetical protein